MVKNPDERRNEIISVATKLFMKNGYYETSVSDIVKECGVAQGTFYYYFKTKEEIFNEIVNTLPLNHFERLNEELLNFDNSKDKLKFICTSFVNINFEHLTTYTSCDTLPVSFTKIISGMLISISKLSIKTISDILFEGIKNNEFTVNNVEFTSIAFVGLLKELIGCIHIAKESPWTNEEITILLIQYLENMLNTTL